MAVRIVPASEPAAPVDLVLWRLVKAQRTAQAALRVLPFGSELRISVDGELCYTEMSADVRTLAREKRHAFEVRGWSDEPSCTILPSL